MAPTIDLEDLENLNRILASNYTYAHTDQIVTESKVVIFERISRTGDFGDFGCSVQFRQEYEAWKLQKIDNENYEHYEAENNVTTEWITW